MSMHEHTITGGPADGPYARLAQAWQWLEDQRRDAPDGADVWDIRWQHLSTGPGWLTALLETLQTGRYRLSPLQLHGRGEEKKAVWGAQDALVLKWVALMIQDSLPLHPSCEHVKGHGGGRQSVAKLHHLLMQPASAAPSEKKTQDDRDYRWVCRTDIRGYYRHIRKQTLLSQVRQHIQDPVLTDLVDQYIHYTVEDGGTFHTPQTGISRGCPLSPLMGALHLYDMDAHFSAQKNIHYARYMDDVIILAKSRWSLRRHTKRLKQWFSAYGFEAHPDKTQIGKTTKGFDWMGAWLTDEGVTDIAPRAKANYRDRVRRLYEQLARVPHWLRKRRQQQVHARVSAYRRRWNIWAIATVSYVASTTLCEADGPIVVLGPSASLGYLDTVFPTSGSLSFPRAYDTRMAAGVCITGRQGYCQQRNASYGGWHGDWGENYPGVQEAWVIVPDKNQGFVLAIAGTGYWNRPIKASDGKFINCSASYEGVRGWGGTCLNGMWTFGNDWTTVTGFNYKGKFSTMEWPGWYDGPRSSSWNLVLRPFVTGPLVPGATELTYLFAGDFIGNNSTGEGQVPLSRPTQVIVSGLVCNLSLAGEFAGGAVNLGDAGSGPDGTIATTGKVTVGGLQTTCSGTNSTDPGATVQLAAVVSPGGDSKSYDGNKIYTDDDWGHYITLSDPAIGGTDQACTSGAMQFTQPIKLAQIAPGGVGKTSVTNVAANLCNWSYDSVPGPHHVSIVFNLINY